MTESSDSVDKSRAKSVKVDEKDCLLNHMEISVSESEKRSNSALNIRDSYIVYLIETRIVDPGGWELIEHGLGQIWRRYSEFEQLRHYLSTTYPWAVVPPLPEKRQSFPVHGSPSDTFDPDFVDRRTAGLENFLHRIAQHPIMSRDSMFLVFLQQEDGWRQSMTEIGYVKMAEDKIKALKALVRTRETDPDFELLRKYIDDLRDCLSSVLKCRARASHGVFNIRRLSSSYGKIFSEWSGIEKEMGDGLQQAGHFFDSIAAAAEPSLEDEEQIIDQIKEYLFFTSSLEDICVHKALLHLEIDELNELVDSKNLEKDNIIQKKYGVLTKIFSTGETEERQTQRIANLDEKIRETQVKIKEEEDNLNVFRDKSLKDIENFQKQKVSDLKDTLEAYIKHQIKMAKKGLHTWENIKDCINSIPS